MSGGGHVGGPGRRGRRRRRGQIYRQHVSQDRQQSQQKVRQKIRETRLIVNNMLLLITDKYLRRRTTTSLRYGQVKETELFSGAVAVVVAATT